MPDVPPLSARSVAVSLLLGAHPARLTAGQLVAAGEHVGVPPATTRVALTRAVAAGDLAREDGAYVLGARHAARREHQDEAVLDAEEPWTGDWETAVVVTAGRPAAERGALRDLLAAHRLAELREGVWLRPANLRRPATYADHPDLAVLRSVPAAGAAGVPDGPALAARLWDLDGWARDGDRLGALLVGTTEPGPRLAAAAALVRHLATDPLLPPTLLPAGWPGPRLREQYADYRAELRALLAT